MCELHAGDVVREVEPVVESENLFVMRYICIYIYMCVYVPSSVGAVCSNGESYSRLKGDVAFEYSVLIPLVLFLGLSQNQSSQCKPPLKSFTCNRYFN